MKVWRMEPCPRCKSRFTGEIIPTDILYGNSFERRDKMLLKGHMYKYVSPQEFNSYYRISSVNAFCFSCGYEFIGKVEKFDMKKQDWMKFITENHLLTENLHLPLRKRIAFFLKRRK